MQTIGQAQSSPMEQQTDQPKHSKAHCLNLLKEKPTQFIQDSSICFIYALVF